MPHFLQLDSNIPDYWNDHRYSADYGWQAANNPRFGNETGFIESSPAGYKGPDLMDASVIASQEAQYGQQNTNQPFLAQTASGYVPDFSEQRFQPFHIIHNLYDRPGLVNETDYFADAKDLAGYSEPVDM